MPLFGGRRGPTQFPRAGNAGTELGKKGASSRSQSPSDAPRAPGGSGKGFGGPIATGGKGSGDGSAGSAPNRKGGHTSSQGASGRVASSTSGSVEDALRRVKVCRTAIAQINEMLKMDRSDDLCPMLDMLLEEANTEVTEMQQAGEACILEERFDVMEQIATIAGEFEDVRGRAAAWKAGRSGGSPAGAGAQIGNSAASRLPDLFDVGGRGHVDDEQIARELAAQLEEEQRATPAQSAQSFGNSRTLAQDGEHDKSSRGATPAAEGALDAVASPSAGPAGGEGGGANKSASRGGAEVKKKREKKEKRPKAHEGTDTAWASNPFGGVPLDAEPSPVTDVTSDAFGNSDGPGGTASGGGFFADFAHPSGDNAGSIAAFPPQQDFPMPASVGSLGSSTWGATVEGTSWAPPVSSEPFGGAGSGGPTFDRSPQANAGQVDSADSAALGSAGAWDSSNNPWGTFEPPLVPAIGGAFEAPGSDAPSASQVLGGHSPSPLAFPSSPAGGCVVGGDFSLAPETHDAPWHSGLTVGETSIPPSPAGRSVGVPSSWNRSRHAEHATMHIRCPYEDIARDLEGFKAEFVSSIARAAGISKDRIRVQSVRRGGC
eukprot:TRINITY_DN38239_c0_g1_i1.p1 TRINITY_DN38239_c0_g1~~TRINITY_DN38239_c0_g1_i1.p1  ORF type:complete len:602 (+),score=94.47 TRINITY_DN38239_c0_g1_i1:130-1935(+)